MAAYARAEEILKKHKKQLDSVANALLELETLDGVQFKALYDGKTTAKKLAEEVKAQEHLTRIRNEEEAAGMNKLIAQQEEDEAREMMELSNDDMPTEEELAVYDRDYFKEDVTEAPKAEAKPKKATAKAEEEPDTKAPTRTRKPKAEAADDSKAKTQTEEKVKPAPKKPSPKKTTKKDE